MIETNIENIKTAGGKEESYKLALESILRWTERTMDDSFIVDAINNVVRAALEKG